MELRCFGILFSLNLALMTVHSALPPELYWERMLPNTPMPKPILELLNLGVKLPHIIEWKNSRSSFYNYKDAMKPFYINKDTKENQEFQSQDDVPFYQYKGDEKPFYIYKDTVKNKKTQSQDDVPFYQYKDAKKPFYIYKGTIKDHETQSQNDVPFYQYKRAEKPFYIYKGTEKNQEIQSQDDVPFYQYKGAKKPFYIYKGTKNNQETQSQDDVPFYQSAKKPFYIYKDTKKNQKTQSQDDVPFYRYKGAEKPFYIYKGTMKNQETQSQDGVPFYQYKSVVKPFYIYKGTTKNQETQSQDDVPFYHYKGVKKPFYIYKDTMKNQETQSQDEFPFYHGSNYHHQLHEIANADIILKEEDLRPGTKLEAHFSKKKYTTPLLPRQVAEHIPFSSERKREILETLLVKPEDAEIVETTMGICEAPSVSGEEKHCETSLESMVDFVVSKLGNKNVQVVSTEVEKDIKQQKFSVKDGVTKIAENSTVVACHPMNYPYTVFYCHQLLDGTNAYFIPLEGDEDGARVKAVALCHKDTSEWNPNHVAFQVLKAKPGDPVCHILDQGSLVWFNK